MCERSVASSQPCQAKSSPHGSTRDRLRFQRGRDHCLRGEISPFKSTVSAPRHLAAGIAHRHFAFSRSPLIKVFASCLLTFRNNFRRLMATCRRVFVSLLVNPFLWCEMGKLRYYALCFKYNSNFLDISAYPFLHSTIQRENSRSIAIYFAERSESAIFLPDKASSITNPYQDLQSILRGESCEKSSGARSIYFERHQYSAVDLGGRSSSAS